MTDEMKPYRVNLRSKSGFWEQYSGHVDVLAESYDDAVERAIDRLRRGAFFDRPRDAWIVERIHRTEREG